MNILKFFNPLSGKDVESPSLGKMWMCRFDFLPWEPDEFNVVFREVEIDKACATKDGIWVEAKANDVESTHILGGYVGKFTPNWKWIGFFPTENQAKDAFNCLVDKWIKVIESKKPKIGNI